MFRRRLDRAEVVSEVRSSGKDGIEQPQPGCARIWLVDSGMPPGLDMVYEMIECLQISRWRAEVWPNAECDWTKLLKESLKSNREVPVDGFLSCIGSTLAKDNIKWIAGNLWRQQFGEIFGMAAFSALNVPENPERIGMCQTYKSVVLRAVSDSDLRFPLLSLAH